MAKKTIEPVLAEIKKLLGNEKLVLGTEETLKNLKQGKVAKVYLASNASEDLKRDIEKYVKLSGAELEQLSQNNKDLGTVCKKPFAISVLSLLK
jgi:large subunit ribosomal protein L30e